MDKSAAIEVIRQFRKAIEAKNLKVDKIILFGSYAFGAQSEGSDIDVVVISEDFRNKSYWERIEILSDAIYEVFEPIEAVALTPEEWERGDNLVAEYAKNGESI